MEDKVTFMERIIQKDKTKRELKFINCMRIKWNIWDKYKGLFQESHSELTDVYVDPYYCRWGFS